MLEKVCQNTGTIKENKRMSGNVWWTSDTHFNHGNIIKYSSRPFTNVDDMNNYLLNEINKRVMPNDILIHAGDWLFGPDKINNLIKFRNRIACQNIYTVWGNHDRQIRREQSVRDCFVWTGSKLEEWFNKKYFTVDHYSCNVWDESHKGAYHLYGHSHGTLPDNPNSQSFDCGVDTDLFGHEKYTPYSFEEIDHIMKTYKKFSPIDHHNTKTNP